MDITFGCPSCDRQLSVPQEYGGQRGTCPVCGTALTVPPLTAPPLRAVSGTAPARPDDPLSTAAHSGRPAAGYYAVSGSQTHGLAILSLVLAVAGVWMACFPLSIAGLVCGIKARNAIADTPDVYRGEGFATAGIIVSGLFLAAQIGRASCRERV